MDTTAESAHLQAGPAGWLKQMCDVAAGGWKDLWEGEEEEGLQSSSSFQRPAQSSSPSYAPVADVGQ